MKVISYFSFLFYLTAAQALIMVTISEQFSETRYSVCCYSLYHDKQEDSQWSALEFKCVGMVVYFLNLPCLCLWNDKLRLLQSTVGIKTLI